MSAPVTSRPADDPDTPGAVGGTRHVWRPVLPSQDDPVVTGVSEVIGGPVGSRAAARRGSRFALVVAVLLTVAACGLGFLQKADCRDGWANGDAYRALCYTDIVPLYTGRGLADGQVPYQDYPVEYPVLTGAVMHVVGTVARATTSDPARGATRFFDLTVLVMTVSAMAMTWATVRLSGRRPWDATLVALAPGLALSAFINWDLFAVGLLMLGLLLWGRRQPLFAGVLIGLATAAKFFPLVLLGPLFLLCLRAGRMRAFWLATAGAFGSWFAVNLPIILTARELPARDGGAGTVNGWLEFYRFSELRGADWGSFWYWFGTWRGTPLSVDAINLLGTLTFAVWCLGVAVLALTAPRRPRVASLMFLTTAGFLLTNKVWSPQYLLWLLPLAVLARPRWRDLLIWQLGEVAYFVGIWLYLLEQVEPGKGITSDLYFVTLFARSAGVLWLVAVVVRDIWRPDLDPVRAGPDGQDDPAGGPLADAPDRFVLPLRRAATDDAEPRAADAEPEGLAPDPAAPRR